MLKEEAVKMERSVCVDYIHHKCDCTTHFLHLTLCIRTVDVKLGVLNMYVFEPLSLQENAVRIDPKNTTTRNYYKPQVVQGLYIL